MIDEACEGERWSDFAAIHPRPLKDVLSVVFCRHYVSHNSSQGDVFTLSTEVAETATLPFDPSAVEE